MRERMHHGPRAVPACQAWTMARAAREGWSQPLSTSPSPTPCPSTSKPGSTETEREAPQQVLSAQRLSSDGRGPHPPPAQPSVLSTDAVWAAGRGAGPDRPVTPGLPRPGPERPCSGQNYPRS